MNSLHLKQLRWINPWHEQAPDQTLDLSWHDGRWQPLQANQAAVDASGLWLVPALIDTHQHLARPDQSARLAGELQAAWDNGFSVVCAAPDCQPIIDNASVIEWIEQAVLSGGGQQPHLQLLGALCPQLNGDQLADMAALLQAGCSGLGLADAALPDWDLLRQALRYAADLKARVHLSPRLRAFPGCAHDGVVASALGLAGVPAVSEALAVSAIVELVRDTGCAVHINKLSSAAALGPLRQARSEGLPISADVALWNLLFNEHKVSQYDPVFHLQPPLRAESDRQALRAALADGSIDAICSDHRPLGFDDKFGPFADTRPGANGLDGFLFGALQLLDDELTPAQLFSALSRGPAALLDLPQAGKDWLLIDPSASTEQNQLSGCPHSPLKALASPGQIIARVGPQGLQIREPWRQRLGV